MQLKLLLEVMDSTDGQVGQFTKKIALIEKQDKGAKLLMTVPGIDCLTTLTIMAEIADIARFSTPWKMVAYTGLLLSHRDYAGKVKRWHITKQESRWLRFALVEAANTAKAHDERLSRFFSRIEGRRGLRRP